MMEWYEYLLIIVVGFCAAFLNTVGGGGSLFTVPILTFLGMPITLANATSRVAILSQNIFAVFGFASKKVELPVRYSFWLCLTSLIGGFIGSTLASSIDDKIFSRLFVVVMLISLALVLDWLLFLMGATELAWTLLIAGQWRPPHKAGSSVSQ